MNTTQKWQAIQRAVGARPDGDPGPMTADAIGAKLGISFADPVSPTPNPSTNSWPRDIRREMVAFYGEPGENHTKITVPYPLYYEGQRKTEITVHSKIAAAVLRVLEKTLLYYGAEGVHTLKLDVYDGCFNDRPKRGGTSRSVHAYAAALDFCAEFNSLHQDHTTALFAKQAYIPWFEFWEAEGAVSLGRSRDFDYQHVQFASLI